MVSSVCLGFRQDLLRAGSSTKAVWPKLVSRQRWPASGVWRGRLDLQQFDPVAKGIVDENPVIAFQRLVMRDRAAGPGQDCGQCGEVLDEEGRVRLARRGKIPFDPEMHLQLAVLEPAAAAAGEFGRFLGLGNAKD